MFKRILFVVIIMFCTATALPAVENGGVDVPDTMTLEGGKGELVLNGTGIRKKFGFKVYVAGLYVKAKTTDSQTIINEDEPMSITMAWKRTGPVNKVTGVFADGFKYAAGENYDALKGDIEKFLKTIVKAKKKDLWKYIYIPGEGTSIIFNDELKTTIPGLDFKKALLSVWLLEGETFDGDKKLRDGMLGK